ncbi:MAG: class I SAM-dependent methyltransferase [Patescibacteria group bacterium]|nr:class I SAM-dependent methyltransferase [Patescibacteria group bacterium]
MNILPAKGFPDYELIDSGNGQRLERFGKYILVRPDPQIIWKPKKDNVFWEKADAFYVQNGNKGSWDNKGKVPQKWLLNYKNLSFFCKLTPFKHTGVFPEQSLHWDFMEEKLRSFSGQPNVLNLFGYTGIASLVCAASGAKVTHVDASKSSISWARENQDASGLLQKPIRWIMDDVIKFVGREVKRNVRYDVIIMDPPIYGHGPEGEKWDFNQSFPKLMELCKNVLSANPLFIIVNAYAISSSSIMLDNVLKDYLSSFGGNFEYGELALQETEGARLLSTGIFARWFR